MNSRTKTAEMKTTCLRFAILILSLTLFWWAIYLNVIPEEWRPRNPIFNIGVVPKWAAVAVAIFSAISVIQFAGKVTYGMPGSIGRPISKKLSSIAPKYGCVSAIALVSLLIGGIARWELSPSLVTLLFGVIALGGFIATLNRGFAMHHGQRAGLRSDLLYSLIPSGVDLLKSDTRPPILYLRSFSKELERATSFGKFGNYMGGKRSLFFVALGIRNNEELWGQHWRAFPRRFIIRKIAQSGRSTMDQQMIFAEFFRLLGPYIAIGRPGEGMASMDLGASKLYVSDADWQQTVLDLIDRSAAVILEAGDSKGLQWEIEEVTTTCDPEKLLIILPRRESEYRSFCLSVQHIFPRALPDEPPESRLLMFDEAWGPIELENPTWSVEDALAPFCRRLNLTIGEPESSGHS